MKKVVMRHTQLLKIIGTDEVKLEKKIGGRVIMLDIL
jgi:hypothetical protein